MASDLDRQSLRRGICDFIHVVLSSRRTFTRSEREVGRFLPT